MKPAQKAMALGLRVLNKLAGASVVDRLGLREPAQRALYQAARAGFGAASAVGRGVKATQRLLSAKRPAPAAAADLFDLTPTDEQQMLREAVRDFAAGQLRPAAGAADAASGAPPALLQQAAELGLHQLGIPEAFGGAGNERAATSGALVAEALAHGDMGLAVACLAPGAVANALALWGTPQQQSAWLPQFAGAQPPVAALALMEPQPLFDPFTLTTTARAVKGGFMLDGIKSLVPRGAEARLLLVAAKLEDHGPALFLVESGTRGLSASADPAMGLRAAATARIELRRATVPTTALLGDGAAKDYADCVALSRLAWCALAVGTAQAVLDYVIPYVNERKAFGEPVSHRQSVAFAVANMGIELEGMRLLTWRAAALAERGQPVAQATALARRLCADHGMRIGSDGVQLLGGHGFTREHPVERWYRDLRAAGLMEGAVLLA